MSIPEEGRKKVFVSYSHTDSEWLKRLQIHLKPLERDGLVDFWDDTRIQTGAQWRREISDALNTACAAVLLISADFIASNFIAENELPPLLVAAESDGLVILPLILSASRFEKIENLARFQSINPPSKPLIELNKGEQERYLVKLSDDVLRAVEEAQTKPTRSGDAGRPRVFNVPFPRNRFFTGRGEILERLRTEFQRGERAQSLNGLGGIGKTQTALEYAYRHREEYKVVLWGKAHSRESLVADFAEMAGLLNLPEKSAQDQSEAVGAVKRWLENNNGWLLILDNADELVMAREFIPLSETGHVLLTTRAQNTGEIAERNDVEKMGPREGALFLLRRLRKLKKDEPLESALEESRKQAKTLSEALGGLPLALDQAAAFIEETQSTLEKYLNLYQSERAGLLARRGELATDHPSVTITFSLAFKKVEEASPAAADLLRLCAFLEADAIPEEIFSKGAGELGEALGPVAAKPLGLTEVIAEAGRFSLLQRNPETDMVSLHRLAQATLKDEMDIEAERIWAERAVRAVDIAFPDVEYSSWPLCGRLIIHAQSLAGLIDQFGFEFPEASFLLSRAGFYLHQRAQYEDAEPLYHRALAIREKPLGAEHPSIALVLNNLAALYSIQGKYVEAEPLYHRALAIYEKALGAEHPDVGQGLNNLAWLYSIQGKYRDAESLFQRALAIYEKELGMEHQDIATILNNLAELYRTQNKYGDAEPLYHRALAIREKALDAGHPDIGQSLNNLALLYDNQGKYGDAEPLYHRAIAICEKALGAEHPDVGQLLNNLALLYDNLSQYAKAEPLYYRALAISEKALGVEHPNVATSLNNLADLYRTQGKYREAEPLFHQALAIREKALGAEHLDVATSLNDLAVLYSYQGKYVEAELFYHRALTIFEKLLGAEHPDAATVLKNYASLLRKMNREEEAAELESRIQGNPDHSD